MQPHGAHISSINADRALIGIVKTHQQVHDRRLSRSRGAYNPQRLAPLQPETDVLQVIFNLIIGKGYVVKFHVDCTILLASPRFFLRSCLGLPRSFLLSFHLLENQLLIRIQDLHNTRGRSRSLRNHDKQPGNGHQRIQNDRKIRHERQYFSNLRSPLVHPAGSGQNNSHKPQI